MNNLGYSIGNKGNTKTKTIKTNYCRSNCKILKDGTDPMYRIFGQFQETIHHIVAGCPVIMSWPILNTHTHTAKPPWSYLHWNICKEMNIDTNEKWSEHEPETVTRQHHNLVANANANRY